VIKIGFFRTKAKYDGDGTERRIETLYLVKHKAKPQMTEDEAFHQVRQEQGQEESGANEG